MSSSSFDTRRDRVCTVARARLSRYPDASAVAGTCPSVRLSVHVQGPGTDPATVQTIRDAIKTGDEITVRVLNYKRSGAPFWNMFTLAPMKDSDGTIRFLVGVQVRGAGAAVECVDRQGRAREAAGNIGDAGVASVYVCVPAAGGGVPAAGLAAGGGGRGLGCLRTAGRVCVGAGQVMAGVADGVKDGCRAAASASP